MKCPCCNGTGRTPMVTIVKTDSGLPCDFPCIECDGTGEVEMTNEYFLQTATTEQLAEEIYKLVWCSNELFQQMECSGIDTKENDLKIVTEWLKQPHTPR